MQVRHADVVSRGAGAGSVEMRTTFLGAPGPGEVRVAVETAGVSFGDVLFQRGVVPNGPKIPFIPGCDLTGTVEAVGAGVTELVVGQRVTALVVSGGYTSGAVLAAARLVPVPDGLDPVQVSGVTLNYFIAHQMLHRIAKVVPGQRILVHGAAGGVGLAFLQLLREVGDVTTWGTCSAANADLVRHYGATPIDYRGEDFVKVVRAGGGKLDAVFDAIGGTHFISSYRLLGRGGRVVAYGQSGALRDGKPSKLTGAIGFLGGILAPKLIPDGRSAAFFNAWTLEKSQPQAYAEDLATVLDLLVAGKIAPRSVEVLALRDAEIALHLQERGFAGKIVLDARDA